VFAAAQAPETRYPPARDSTWLRGELESIWGRYFADVPRVNRIDIAFQRTWKRRLGVISMSSDRETTRIGINALLSLPEAPYCLTLVTVAHELVHYSHGFGSPLPQRYPHPHRGGVVTRELRQRGLATQLAEYSDWLHGYWWSFYARQQSRQRRARRSAARYARP
jgi:hypothetical protein